MPERPSAKVAPRTAIVEKVQKRCSAVDLRFSLGSITHLLEPVSHHVQKQNEQFVSTAALSWVA